MQSPDDLVQVYAKPNCWLLSHIYLAFLSLYVFNHGSVPVVLTNLARIIMYLFLKPSWQRRRRRDFARPTVLRHWHCPALVRRYLFHHSNGIFHLACGNRSHSDHSGVVSLSVTFNTHQYSDYSIIILLIISHLADSFCTEQVCPFMATISASRLGQGGIKTLETLLDLT